MVLDEYGRHLHLLDGERVVDETFAVALLEPEAAHLLLGERQMGHGALAHDAHLAVYDVTEQSGAPSVNEL